MRQQTSSFPHKNPDLLLEKDRIYLNPEYQNQIVHPKRRSSEIASQAQGHGITLFSAPYKNGINLNQANKYNNKNIIKASTNDDCHKELFQNERYKKSISFSGENTEKKIPRENYNKKTMFAFLRNSENKESKNLQNLQQVNKTNNENERKQLKTITDHDIQVNYQINNLIQKDKEIQFLKQQLENYQKHERKISSQSELTDKYIQLMARCNKLEDDLDAKQKELSKVHQNLIKPEQQVNSQYKNSMIKKLAIKCQNFQQQNANSKEIIIKLKEENAKLKEQIQQNKQTQSQKIITSSKQSYAQLGESFEKKINDLIDQNYRLKNSLTTANGKINQLDICNQSYKSIILAFQERDNSNHHQNILEVENQKLRIVLDEEREEKDKLISKYELEIMKLQNKMDGQRFMQHGSLIGDRSERLQESMKDALDEIQKLKLKIMEQEILIAKQK